MRVGVTCSELGSGGGCALASRGQRTHRGQPASGADRVLSGTATNLCEVPAKDRVDCGYPEISSEQCTNRGCCFDSSIHGVPWCFKPLQDTGKPSRAHSILPGSPEAMHTPAGPSAPWLSVS